MSNAQLAEALGVARSTPGLWLKDGATSIPDRDSIRNVAKVFNRPISEVLTRAGYATEEELRYSAPPVDAGKLTNAQLLAELSSRLPDDPVDAPQDADPADAPPKVVKARRVATGRR
ncbi:hypothetical protein ACWIGI_28505 [Nocardia sp. NPDC055321]